MNKLVLVFDTETTGLPKSKNYKNIDDFKNSRLIQFSAILYDFKEYKVIKEYDIYMKRDGFTINNSHIHKITNEFVDKNGKPITDFFEILNEILNVKPCVMVGHNISFDMSIIKSELFRYNQLELLGKFKKINCFCTMKNSVCITKIKRKNGSYKYPKLKELYQFIFGKEPKNLHNSLYDTRYTLDCLKELYYNNLIKLFV
jgi:DNA polymerase III epsilon subunit-like protein